MSSGSACCSPSSATFRGSSMPSTPSPSIIKTNLAHRCPSLHHQLDRPYTIASIVALSS
ncbi:hypothetical protein PR202_ga11194 [Eleusine coracana subsp. coracana]|uniref:Uncharacterized protein n=1 Tax=Eleusine coracana subsp. coracana TaxID=191504 RepID=A0AAV5C8Q7_ELECO|nr:hypothetical protein PR202_ga11194 [Eleusine coracana subsp. coracana]